MSVFKFQYKTKTNFFAKKRIMSKRFIWMSERVFWVSQVVKEDSKTAFFNEFSIL